MDLQARLLVIEARENAVKEEAQKASEQQKKKDEWNETVKTMAGMTEASVKAQLSPLKKCIDELKKHYGDIAPETLPRPIPVV